MPIVDARRSLVTHTQSGGFGCTCLPVKRGRPFKTYNAQFPRKRRRQEARLLKDRVHSASLHKLSSRGSVERLTRDGACPRTVSGERHGSPIDKKCLRYVGFKHRSRKARSAWSSALLVERDRLRVYRRRATIDYYIPSR